MENILEKALFKSGMIPTYSKLADLSTLRHKLIASNIANVNTPGYREKQIDFDGELKKAITKPAIKSVLTDPRHIPLGNTPGGPPKIHELKKSENSTGVNSVDIDTEMADMAQNQIVFDYTADMLARQFKGLRTAIRGTE